MVIDTGGKILRQVEVDETFRGGKARNLYRNQRVSTIHGQGGSGKIAVKRLFERHGKVRTVVDPT